MKIYCKMTKELTRLFKKTLIDSEEFFELLMCLSFVLKLFRDLNNVQWAVKTHNSLVKVVQISYK